MSAADARRWRAPATAVAAVVVLGALVLLLPSPGRLGAAASALPALTWLVAAAGWLASYALRAQRIHEEWTGRTGMRWPEALNVTLVHSAAINLIPMRAGEACFPWLMHRRWRVATGDALASLLWLRLQDAVVLLTLAGAALLPWGAWPLRLTAAVLLLAGLAHALPRAARRVRPDAGWGARLLAPLAHASPRSWLWSVLNWTVKSLASAHLVAALLSLDGAAAATWRCWPAGLTAELGGALPVQVPSGFGAWEAGFWLGLQSTGAVPWRAADVLGAALTAHVALVLFGAAAAALMQLPVLRAWRTA